MTKLFLRNTTTNGISGTGDGILYDLLTTAGTSPDTAVTNTTASGTEIQATKTAGGSTIAWISGRAPSGGFTLTTSDISLWQQESNMNANIGGRYRIFKRTAAGVITELGGGPFDDLAEMATTNQEDTWVGNPTDTAFAEDDRILIRYYLTNIGTMGGSFTGTMSFNAADATTGDSFFNIAETVVFKSDPISVALTGVSATGSVGSPSKSLATALSGSSATSAVGTVTPGITFPPSTVSDDFNRADGGLGANWTQLWSFATLAITGNAVGADGAAFWAGAGTFSDDQYSEITIVTRLSGGTQGAGVRLSGSTFGTAKGYFCGSSSSHTANRYGIFRMNADSTLTVLASASDSSDVTNGDVIRLAVTASGGVNTLTGTKNGVDIPGLVGITDSSIGAGGKPGFAVGTAADNWSGSTATASGDVTLALTGVVATSNAGSLGVDRATSLTGSAATSSIGILAPSRTMPLTGNAATASVGSVTPSRALGLAGVGASSALGTLTPSRTVSISGNSATSSVGTVTPVIGVTVALSGVESTVTTAGVGFTKSGAVQVSGVQVVTGLGTVELSNSLSISGAQSSSAVNTFGLSKSGQLALTGVSSSLAVQSLTPNLSNAISNVTSTQSAGTLPVARSVNLSGISITVDIGSVGASSPGEAALSGVSTTPAVGTLGFTKSGQIAVTGVQSTTALGDVGFSESGQLEASGNQATGQVGDVLINRTVALTGSEATGIAGTASLLTATAISGSVITSESGSISASTNLSITSVTATSESGTIVFTSNTIIVALSGVLTTATVASMLPYDANPSYTATLTVISKPAATLTVEQQSANITVVLKPSAVLGLI